MIVCSCIFLPASICICWPSPFSSIYVHSVLVFKQIRGYLFSQNTQWQKWLLYKAVATLRSNNLSNYDRLNSKVCFFQKAGCPIFQKAGCPIFKNSGCRLTGRMSPYHFIFRSARCINICSPLAGHRWRLWRKKSNRRRYFRIKKSFTFAIWKVSW